MFVLAHLSDPHLGPLPRPRTMELASKRMIGYVNWQRNRVRSLGGQVLAGLIEDMLARKPDHIAVTGDLVNIALPAEIVAAGEWLKAVGAPHDVSFVPGNHDAYVPGVLAKALALWAPYATGDDGLSLGRVTFPYLRRRGPAAIIGVSSARASGPFMATGHVDAQCLPALRDRLIRAREDGLFRVVLIHHPPFKHATGWHKRLVGAGRIRAIIKEVGAELILHGHTHIDSFESIEGPHGRVPVIGVPSAANAPGGHKPAGRYNLFGIEGEPGNWRCSLVERGYGAPGSGIEVIRERNVG
ncbi:metallophosphoesterase family protein [Kaistia terrae]|uniref:Metallophosphoesterase family protein n=1 Tax=Kaistia terrae TaxID=537017 RepID=A0ABW0PQ39_9HYPH|nr:metallophosphoesterase [Kaistia terrae]MCX5578001.1 metallophosphoesterase [Kaistia terrae]